MGTAEATRPAGTAITGTTFVGLLRVADLLGTTPVGEALVRFWVGDAVGVLITAPLLLVVADAERRTGLLILARRRDTLLQIAVLLAAIWLTFYGLKGDPATHFYLLFVPLIWIAARGGLNGAVVATAIVQVGLVIGIHREGAESNLPVLELHALVAALTLTGLYLGMMVDERQRATENLKQSLRLAAAGEMAGAIVPPSDFSEVCSTVQVATTLRPWSRKVTAYKPSPSMSRSGRAATLDWPRSCRASASAPVTGTVLDHLLAIGFEGVTVLVEAVDAG